MLHYINLNNQQARFGLVYILVLFSHKAAPHFPIPTSLLLGFPVQGVLFAERAVLFQFNTFRIVFLVFGGIVVSVLALGAS